VVIDPRDDAQGEHLWLDRRQVELEGHQGPFYHGGEQ
jgi:hypothetical protein